MRRTALWAVMFVCSSALGSWNVSPATAQASFDPGAPWPRFVLQELPIPAGAEGGVLAVLHAADTDGDRAADLLAVWTTPGGSVIATYRATSRGWEHRGEPPFEAPRVLLRTSSEVVFATVCDVDRDGGPDVVFADRLHPRLLWFPAGRPGERARGIPLPGTVTALAAVDWGRHDALLEPAAGIRTTAGPALALFQPIPPEPAAGPAAVVPVSGTVRTIVAADLDGNGWGDLAVGTDTGLVLVDGTDTGGDGEWATRRRATPVPSVRGAIRVLAATRFLRQTHHDVPVLTSHGLRLLDPRDGSIRSAAGGPLRSAGGLSSFAVVWEGAGRGPAVALPRPGGIEFVGDLAVEGSTGWRAGASAILPLGSEPTAVLPIGRTADGMDDLVLAFRNDPRPRILLSRSRATFTITTNDDHDDGACTVSDCTLREAINAANGSAGPDTISTTNPYFFSIGSDLPAVTGTTTFDLNNQSFWYIDGDTAGGTTGLWIQGDSCVVYGLYSQHHHVNGAGLRGAGIVLFQTEHTTLIEAAALENDSHGIELYDAIDCSVWASSQRNGASGFFVYRNANGSTSGNRLHRVSAGQNQEHGIHVNGAVDTEIGGTATTSVASSFSNGGDGIRVEGAGATGTSMARVRVGDNGTPPAVSAGVGLYGCGATSVGLALTGATSHTTGNHPYGILVQQTTASVAIAGFQVGYEEDGTATGNDTDGIRVDRAPDVTIRRSIISNNGLNGIEATGASGNLVSGLSVLACTIGASPDGTTAAGNGAYGVNLDWVTGSTVGGQGSGNVIVANGQGGIRIYGTPSTGNTVRDNVIGVTPSGAPMGNSGHGILVEDAPDNVIGPGNVIAFNTGTKGEGILLQGSSATGVNCSGNSIHGNSGLGIDLGADGVTLPDDGDADEGPNHLINQPELVLAESCGGSTWVLGQLRAAASPLPVTLSFFFNDTCDASGMGEGQTGAGADLTLTAPGGGTVHFRREIPLPGGGSFITSITTGPFGSSSEFSNCREITSGRPGDATADCGLMADDLSEIVRAATDPAYTPPGDPDADGNGAPDPADLLAVLVKIFW